jgi:hypothetical protein
MLPLQSQTGEAGQGIDRSLKPHIDNIREMVDDLVRTQPFLFDWMLVMSVTFAEAYLDGALQLLAAADESVMSGSQMLLTGDDILTIDPTLTPEERWKLVLNVLRMRWATQFLREKPTQWISRLEKFGAPTYPPDLAPKLSDSWKARITIIHHRSAEPAQAPSPADRAQERKRVFLVSFGAICDFVDWTDLFVARRTLI